MTIIALTLALAQSSNVKVYTSRLTFYFGGIRNWDVFVKPSFLGLAQWFPPLASNRVQTAGMSAVNVGGLRME